MQSDERKRRLAATALAKRSRDLSRRIVPGLPIDADIVALRRKTHGAKEIFEAAENTMREILRDKNPFWEQLAQRWRDLFPDTAARPSRLVGNTLYLAVPNAAARFALLRRMPLFKKRLLLVPGCPADISMRLEIA